MGVFLGVGAPTSYLNHNKEANLSIEYSKDFLILKALRIINKMEELFINYKGEIEPLK
jgi:hypothetical protein